jgi:hypothetical protein
MVIGSPLETHGLQETQATAVAMGWNWCWPTCVRLRLSRGFRDRDRTPSRRVADPWRPDQLPACQVNRDFALRHQTPSSYEEKAFVEVGGLLSYAPSFTDLFVRAATFVDKILSRHALSPRCALQADSEGLDCFARRVR